MAQLWALRKVGILVGSFLIGFLFFYVVSPLTSPLKKNLLEQISSLLINLVIYIWLGKIVLHINLFIHDPIAVLVYPSDSSAFYVATLAMVLHISWKVWRKKITDMNVMNAFVPIFLAASFIFEFIQMVGFQNSYSWVYIGLLAVLIVLFLVFQDKVVGWKLSLCLMVLWSVGQLIFSFILPFATVFTYIMAPWYLSVLLLMFVGLYLYFNRKLVS